MADQKVRIEIVAEGSRQVGQTLEAVDRALVAIDDLLNNIKTKSGRGVFDALIKDSTRLQKQVQALTSSLRGGVQGEITKLTQRFTVLGVEVSKFVEENPGFDKLTDEAAQLNQQLSQFGKGTTDFTALATDSEQAARFLTEATQTLQTLITTLREAKTAADAGAFDKFIQEAGQLQTVSQDLQTELQTGTVNAVNELQQRLSALAGQLNEVGQATPNFTGFAREVQALNADLATFKVQAESFEALITDSTRLSTTLSGVEDILSRVASEASSLAVIFQSEFFSNFITDAGRFVQSAAAIETEVQGGAIPAIRELIQQAAALALRLQDLGRIDPGFARLGNDFENLNSELSRFQGAASLFADLQGQTVRINANLSEFQNRLKDTIAELNRTKAVIDSGLFDQFITDAGRLQNAVEEIRQSVEGNNVEALKGYSVELSTLVERLQQAASTDPNLNRLTADFQDLNSELQRFNSDITSLQQLDGQVQQVDEALGRLPSLLQQVVAEVSTLRSAVQSDVFGQFVSEIGQASTAITAFGGDVERLTSTGVETFANTITELFNTFRNLTSTFPQFNDLAGTFNRLNTEVGTLKQDINTFSDLSRDADTLNASLLTIINTLPRVVDEVQQVRTEVNAGTFAGLVDDAVNVRNVTQQIQADLSGQVITAIEEFRNKAEQSGAALREIAGAVPNFSGLVNDVTRINTELTGLTGELDKLQNASRLGEGLTETLNRVTAAINAATVSANNLQTALSEGVFDKVIQDGGRLLNRLEEVRQAVGQSTQAEVDKLKGSIEELGDKIAVVSSTDTNLDRLADEARKVANAADEIGKTNVRDLADGADETADELARVELELKQVSDALKEAKKTADQDIYSSLRRQQIALQQEGAALRREIRAQEQAFKAQDLPEDSIIRLRQRYRELKKEIDGISTADPKFEEKAKEAKRLSDRINELNKEAGSFKENIGRYEESVVSALGATEGLLSGSLDSIVGALGVGGPVVAGLTAIGGTVAVIGDLTNEFIRLRGETQQLTQTTGDQLDTITANVAAIADTYDKDFNEVLVATNALAKQTGISFEESIQLITQGFDAGADATDEFLDKVREYPVQFKNAGFTAEEFIKIATQEVQGGFFNDKLLDAIKESDLALKEFTDTQRTALSALGDEFTANLEEGIRSGTISTQEALLQISNRAKEVGLDFQQFQTITADVFKGAGEDAGGAQRVISEVFTALNTDISEYINGSNELVQRQREQREAALDLNLAIAELSDETGDFVAQTGNLGTRIQTVLIKGITQAVQVFRGFYLQAVQPLVDAFRGLGERLGFFSEQTEDAGDKTTTFQRALEIILSPLRLLINFITGTIDSFNKFVDALKDVAAFFQPVIDRIKETAAFLQPLGDAIAGFTNKVSGAFENVFGLASAARKQTEEIEKAEAAAAARRKTSAEDFNEVLRTQQRILVEGLQQQGLTIEQISNQTGIAVENIESLVGAVGESVSDSGEKAGNALDALQEKQNNLRDAIEERILAGEPFAELEAEYVQVTNRLNDVNTRFNDIGDKITKAAEKVNNLDLAKARTELERTFQTLESSDIDSSFVQSLVKIEDQLLQVAQKSGDIEELTQKVEQLKERLQSNLSEVGGNVSGDIDDLLKSELLTDAQFAQVKGLIELQTALQLQSIQSQRAIQESVEQTGDVVQQTEADKRAAIEETLQAEAAAGDITAEGIAGTSQSVSAEIQARKDAAEEIFETERAFALREQEIKLQGEERLLAATVKNLEDKIAREKAALAEIGAEENEVTTTLLSKRVDAENQLADKREELFESSQSLQLQIALDRIDRESEAAKIKAFESIEDEEQLQNRIAEIDRTAAVERLRARLQVEEEGSNQFLAIKRQLAEEEREIDDETAAQKAQGEVDALRLAGAREQLDILNTTIDAEERRLLLKQSQLQTELKILQAQAAQGTETEQASNALQLRQTREDLALVLNDLGQTPDEIATATGLALTEINGLIDQAQRNSGEGLIPQTVFERIQQGAQLVGQFLQFQSQQIQANTQQQLSALDKQLEKRLENVEQGSEEEAAIRAEFEKRREELEKEGAKKRKAIAIKEAIIQTALGIVKAFTLLPPQNFIQAAITAAQGAIQLAAIRSQEFAQGGLVLPELISGRKVKRTEQNIPTRRNGDNVLATVRTGEVVLNEQQQRRLRMMTSTDIFKRLRVPGFQEGGLIGGNTPQVVNPNDVVQREIILSKVEFSDEQINRLANTIASRVAIRTAESVGSEVRAATREEMNRKRLSEQTGGK
jgi:chromosome segregation ATPase